VLSDNAYIKKDIKKITSVVHLSLPVTIGKKAYTDYCNKLGPSFKIYSYAMWKMGRK